MMYMTYIASTETDTLSLHDALPIYFADSIKYTGTTACTSTPGSATYCETTGNTLSGRVTKNTAEQPTIKNAKWTKTCAIFIGSTSNTPATKEGEPKCQ